MNVVYSFVVSVDLVFFINVIITDIIKKCQHLSAQRYCYQVAISYLIQTVL